MWVALVISLATGYFSNPGGGVKSPTQLLSAVQLKAESSWMGIYVGGKKIGYISTELEPSGDGGYVVNEYSLIAGTMLGVGQQMGIRMHQKTDSTLALVSFDGLLDAGLYTSEFKGEVRDKVLTVQVITAGEKQDRYIPAPEPIYLSQSIKPLLQTGRLNAGDSLKLSGFDPITLQLQELYIIGDDLSSYTILGTTAQARKLVIRMSGFETVLYVDAKGDCIAEYGPMGMVSRRETMEVATNLKDAGSKVDFLALYAITPTGMISNEREVQSATYKINGIDSVQLCKASMRHNYNAGQLTVSVPDRSVIDSSNMYNYLKDAPFVESKHKDVRAKAEYVVRGSKTRLDSVKSLSGWVYRSVKKKPAGGIPSALAVLRGLEGDCNEHSVLLTALLRSVNIPARMVFGVVYQEGKFYYHAWVAAMIDGQWLELDPTFGQYRADASRIALTSGDMSSVIELTGLIGAIDVEIVNVTHNKGN